jgi:hypothetical protein
VELIVCERVILTICTFISIFCLLLSPNVTLRCCFRAGHPDVPISQNARLHVMGSKNIWRDVKEARLRSFADGANKKLQISRLPRCSVLPLYGRLGMPLRNISILPAVILHFFSLAFISLSSFIIKGPDHRFRCRIKCRMAAVDMATQNTMKVVSEIRLHEKSLVFPSPSPQSAARR